MMTNCPICDAPHDDSTDRCKTPNCGWQFISLLSDSPAERAAYEEKVKQAKAAFQEQQFNQTPDLIRDPFETNEEFAERLGNRSWFAGSGTLIKTGYNINTGKFPLELHYEPWVWPLPHPDNVHVIVPRDMARQIYEKGSSYPIHAVLKTNAAGEVFIDRIILKTDLEVLDVNFNGEVKSEPFSTKSCDETIGYNSSSKAIGDSNQHIYELLTRNKEGSEKVLQELLKAASTNSAESQFNVGLIYETNQFFQDYQEALKWYEKAANQGLVQAQCSLGLMYYQGLGTPQNAKEAAKWILKAANKGYAQAQIIMGELYALGLGVKKSNQEALNWYQQSLKQGLDCESEQVVNEAIKILSSTDRGFFDKIFGKG